MSTTPNVPYRLEFSVEVPGTPEQVWQAIATAKGMSAWFAPTEMEEREGGSLHFTMGSEMGSDGEVTAWEPPHRLVYTWHLRQDEPDATEVEILFDARPEGGTTVSIEHRGWERLGARGPDRRQANERGWGGLLPHYISAVR